MRYRGLSPRRVQYGVLQARRKVLATILAIWGVAATAEEVDLLAFGDSLTAGYGLIETEGFVPQLRDWLAAQGHEVRVVNAGVSGDTTAGGAARIGWSLTPEIDAMILTLGGNDLLRGIDPAVTRANLDTILSEAEAHGVSVLVVGLRAPDNYGPEYKTAFDAIYPDLAEDYGALYEPSFFAGLGEDDPREARQYFQPDGIHPNADGVRRIIEALGPRVIGLITGAE